MKIFTDVLIIGCGAAALRAALAAREIGVDVLIACKGDFAKSGASYHSVAEVGAYNVPDGAVDPVDDEECYYKDIIEAGLGMEDPILSRILVENAEKSMKYLEDIGVVFEKKDKKYIAFKACFSSRPRSHVIKNHFKPIVKALSDKVKIENIKIIDKIIITNLIVREEQCFGAYALDEKGNPIIIRSKSTVLAAGGASQLFKRNLYPDDVTGDGYAMAYRAGADLVNMEFMQAGVGVVYPFINLFGNYLWKAKPVITNVSKEIIIPKYVKTDLIIDDILADKANHFPFSCRDNSKYVEIAIQQEINKNNGTNHEGVFADFTNTDFEELLNRDINFKNMWDITYEWYKDKGLDLHKKKAEVTCYAHAINGGLKIDGESKTSLNGLYAAGEVAGGPHGADRLGGNMMVTCQVFGDISGKNAAEFSKRISNYKEIKDEYFEEEDFLQAFSSTGKYCLSDLKKELNESADKNLLIVRSKEGLENFKKLLTDLKYKLLNDCDLKNKKNLIEGLELLNLITVGQIISESALTRKESRGSHYREDFIDLSDKFKKQIIIKNKGY